MVEKLKLAHERIPWFLVVKAAVFGLAWFFAPFFAFLIVAAVLFFYPPFQVRRFSPLFLLLIGMAYLLPSSYAATVLLGSLFFILLGMKNLILVDRVFAAESFFIIQSLLLWFLFFSFQLWPSFSFFFTLLVFTILDTLLFSFLSDSEEGGETSGRQFLFLLFSLLIFQFAWVVSLLPLSFAWQALSVTLFSLIFFEVFTRHTHLRLSVEDTRVLIIGGMISGFLLVWVVWFSFGL